MMIRFRVGITISGKDRIVRAYSEQSRDAIAQRHMGEAQSIPGANVPIVHLLFRHFYRACRCLWRIILEEIVNSGQAAVAMCGEDSNTERLPSGCDCEYGGSRKDSIVRLLRQVVGNGSSVVVSIWLACLIDEGTLWLESVWDVLPAAP
jgi:hypothetical protein